jgi:uncharacterized protein
MNKGVMIALLSMGLAQAMKIPLHFAKTGNWKPGLFFQTGGMPSSHSAGVTSLTTYIALKRGFPTIDFALSLVYGLIVMYDAQGVRRQAGELTLRVNDLDELIEKVKKDQRLQYEQKPPKKLKEMLGHEPEEVIGGALFGVLTGALGFYLGKNDRKRSKFRIK